MARVSSSQGRGPPPLRPAPARRARPPWPPRVPCGRRGTRPGRPSVPERHVASGTESTQFGFSSLSKVGAPGPGLPACPRPGREVPTPCAADRAARRRVAAPLREPGLVGRPLAGGDGRCGGPGRPAGPPGGGAGGAAEGPRVGRRAGGQAPAVRGREGEGRRGESAESRPSRGGAKSGHRPGSHRDRIDDRSHHGPKPRPMLIMHNQDLDLVASGPSRSPPQLVTSYLLPWQPAKSSSRQAGPRPGVPMG